MNITSIRNIPVFGNVAQDVNFDAKRTKREKNYKDPLQNYPLRLLGYTNDVGVAINELFPTFATLCWVPALMYFGADVYDKYKNKGNTYDPNAKRAFSQAVFQANASIIMPMLFGHVGASAFSQMEKYKGERLSTNAKEQTLRFIKHFANTEKIYKPGQDKENILKKFDTSFENFYDNKYNSYKPKNVFIKMFDKLLGNCKRGAIANSNKQRITEFANKQLKNIMNTTSDLEALNKAFDKDIFKLKAWKSAGSFTALILTMKFIDTFTENVIIKKVVEPQVAKLDFHKFSHMNDFGKKSEQPKSTSLLA